MNWPFTIAPFLDGRIFTIAPLCVKRSFTFAPGITSLERVGGVAHVAAQVHGDAVQRVRLSDADGIRENLTKYVTSFSPEISDIFDKFKIFDVVKDIDDNGLFFLVVERFCNPRIDLCPASISNAGIGDIYEEPIHRFSEVSNETAGEHFSPRDGLRLTAELLVVGEMGDLTQPNRIVKVCDPCAGICKTSNCLMAA